MMTIPSSSCSTAVDLFSEEVPSYKKLNGARDPQFPVCILPHLYLGNAKNAADKETLDRYGISYILNVTPNLPNTFEEDGDFKYLQIPIQDHWSQNLAAYFPAAIAFISKCILTYGQLI